MTILIYLPPRILYLAKDGGYADVWLSMLKASVRKFSRVFYPMPTEWLGR